MNKTVVITGAGGVFCSTLSKALAKEGYSLEEFNTALGTYDTIDAPKLKEYLFEFLTHIVPVAIKAGVLMCIYPDNPLYPNFGITKICCIQEDILDLYIAIESPYKDLLFCTGLIGVCKNNNLIGKAEHLNHHIHFMHLRSTELDAYCSKLFGRRRRFAQCNESTFFR